MVGSAGCNRVLTLDEPGDPRLLADLVRLRNYLPALVDVSAMSLAAGELVERCSLYGPSDAAREALRDLKASLLGLEAIVLEEG